MIKLIKNIEHERVLKNIDNESSFTPKFFILLTLSTIIATLGLIADNISVVIGAMIIAPLMWPILGVSLSITRQRTKFFHESITLLVLSIIISILVAAIVSKLSPILEINGSILARTNPSIIDLVIALATGAVATYIVLSPQSDSLAGVAVAAALIPPLSAAGISISLGDIPGLKGALLLFGANLFAIILMSIIILSIGGLAKLKTEQEKFNVTLGVLISGTMIALIAIPLAVVLKDSILTNQHEAAIYKTLASDIKIIDNNATISSLSIDGLEKNSNEASITADIKAPFGATLYTSDQETIAEKLSLIAKKKITLDINITPIFKAESYTPPVATTHPLDLIIPASLGKYVSQATMLSYKLDEESSPPTINLNIELPHDIPLTLTTQKNLEQDISQLYNQTIQLRLKLFRYERPSPEIKKPSDL